MAETLQNLALGFSVALQPSVLLYAFVGCVVGTLVGVLPGVGPLAGTSLLLPATFGLTATNAIVMLAGIYYGAMYGGSTTSILMRIPGEAASVMTCIDGYAMARNGRAGAAIGSFIAGTVSVVALMLLAPPLASFALRFGPPEYFALLLLGLLVLAYMSGGSMVKSLAMAVLGLLLGMIGIDQMSGFFRFSYGVVELGDGLGVVPIAVGLFGIAEVLATAGQEVPPEVLKPKLRELLPNRTEWRESAMPIGRGTVLGFLIGIIPGSAHIISSFVSYAVERRLSRHPEAFGHGAVAGVAGPESANISATSGAFVPMLALGVPSGPIPAVMLAALMVHGVSPGTLLITQQPALFWGFIASMYAGNLMLLALNLPMVGLFVNVLRVPYSFLYPSIIMFCVVGVYAVNGSVVDVWIALIMGTLGYILRKLGFETAPIVLGAILAPMIELALRQSLAMSDEQHAIFVSRLIYGTLHMAMELLSHAAGIKLRHVPYAGAGPALTALLGGHVDALASGPSVILPQVKAGKLRPLAGWGDRRVAALPEVPTFKELGYPDAEFCIWAGLFAPKGTPEPVLARLREAARAAVADPEFRSAMDKLETPISFKQGAEFQKFFDADAQRLAEGVRKVGRVEQK